MQLKVQLKMWLVLTLVLFIMGCGGSGDGPDAGDGGGAGAANSEAVLKFDSGAENNKQFDLADKSKLTVKVDPLAAGTAKLVAQHHYSNDTGQIKRLEYRIVTEAAPEAAWLAFEKAKLTSLGGDMAVGDFEADIALTAGNADIQFRVDPGLSKRYELSGWEMTVK
jgi:hypothetical protein